MTTTSTIAPSVAKVAPAYDVIPAGVQLQFGEAPSPPLPPTPIVETVLGFPLDMHKFLLNEIRRMDLFGSPHPGTEFLRHYLDGPNQVWQQTVLNIQSIPELWDVVNIDDEFLQFLKWPVGWTNEVLFAKVTDAISDDALRRLISISGRLWNTRGPEDALIDILSVLSGGSRLRVWNWFDFRWVLDETELGEEHQGRDAWIVDLPSSVQQTISVDVSTPANLVTGNTVSATVPGSISVAVKSGDIFVLRSGPQNGEEAEIIGITGGNTFNFTQGVTNLLTGPFVTEDWEVLDRQFSGDDEYRSNLRIVDKTAAGSTARTEFRTLIKRVLRIMRPSGERWDITYLSFLDRFNITGDDLQWDTGGGNLTVVDGLLKLTAGIAEDTQVIVPEAQALAEYVVATRLRGTSSASGGLFGTQFHWTDSNNYYAVLIDTFDQELILRKVVASVPTDLVTVDLGAVGFNIIADRFYTVRVSIVIEGATNRIQVFVDGFELVNTTDPALTNGTIGLTHTTNAVTEIDEVEAFELSLGTDTLEINENP